MNTPLAHPGDDPAVATAVAARFAVLQSLWATGAAEVAQLGAGGFHRWSGLAAAHAMAQISAVSDALAEGGVRLVDMAAAVDAWAGHLVRTRSQVNTLRERWGDLELLRTAMLAEQRALLLVLVPGLGDPDAPAGPGSEMRLLEIGSQLSTLDAESAQILAEWQQLCTDTEGATIQVCSALVPPPGPVPGRTAVTADGTAAARFRADPRAAWTELSTAQRALMLDLARAVPIPSEPMSVAQHLAGLDPMVATALVVRHPGLGAAPGVPVGLRDLGNRLRLQEDLEQAHGELAALGIGIEGDPGSEDNARRLQAELVLAGVPAARARELRGTLAVQHQLRTARAAVPPEVPVQLLVYEPGAYAGKGRAAISVGDAARADHVAVTVPGMTSDVPGYLDNQMSNALALYRAAAERAEASTAVVAAISYDAPELGLDVTDLDHAYAGASAVRADLDLLASLRVTAAAHVTVIAHSYGSATAAAAFADPVRADDLVLIGSPGVGHGVTAADLGVGARNVWVGSATDDPVTTVVQLVQRADLQAQVSGVGDVLAGPAGRQLLQLSLAGRDLGQDPASDRFGGRRFHAEIAEGTPGNPHSAYYAEGGESLANIAAVVVGRYREVGLAPHRPGGEVHYKGVDPERSHEPGR